MVVQYFARSLITRFVGDQEGADLETRLVDHIVHFSLNGVNAFNKEVANGPQKIKDAAGYGVFSNANVNLLIASAGSGYGVVVNNKTNERTYMKMALGGVGLGLGVKDYRVVMIFPKAETMEKFITEGWEVGGHADAAAKAGDKGAEGSKQGAIGDIETYSFTEAGLALQATLAGSKYWKYDELNE